MATVYVAVDNTAFVEVLDGEGFVVCGLPMQYAFNTSTTITDFFTVEGGGQVNGASGKLLYARSPLQDAKVASTTLA